MIKPSIALLLFLLASVCAYNSHNEQDCASGKKQAVFDILLDPDPQETGWSLACDHDDGQMIIWQVPEGTFTNADQGEWITESSCIDDTATCLFTITDGGRDGLIGDGFYTFRLESTTVGVSDYGAGVPFTKESYCLGPGCDMLPLEQAEDANPYHQEEKCGTLQERAVLEIQLDSKAHESGWLLVCNGETIWNIPTGLLNDYEGTWIQESSCIDKNVTCNFTIFDAGGDGLIDDGFYSLSFGATTVAVSKYGIKEAFTDRSFCFGQDCAEPPLEIAEKAYTYHSEENCAQGQARAVFEISLDANSLETSWGLMCDGQTIWDIPIGSLSEPEGTWITESSCIDRTDNCVFIILDAGGDGLLGDGFFVLRHEASEWGMSTPFTEKSYCFGQGCTEYPLEQDEEEAELQEGDQEGEQIEQDRDTTMGGNGVQNIKLTGSKTKSKTGLIIGVTVGVACFILAFVFLILVIKKKKQNVTACVASEKDDTTRASNISNKAASDTHVSER